jgi:VanZ family protein
VARSRRPYSLLGTLAYTLLVVAILVAPTSAPHDRRGYLAEYHPLGRRLVADVAVNIALFVPLGWGLHHTGRGLGVPPRMLLAAAVLAAGVFSLLMETLQFWLPARYSSIVDVLANTAGALLGAWSAARYTSTGE